MSAPIPYMPLYVSEYLADAAHLNAAEHGAYLLLIMTYWQRGEALPADDRKLSRIARMTEAEWSAAKGMVLEFFEESDGTLKHQRIEHELAGARDKIEKKRSAGRASANSRSTDAQQALNNIDKSKSKKEEEEVITLAPASAPPPIEEAVQSWNEMASTVGLSPIRRLSSARKSALRRRLSEHGMEGWQLCITKIRESPFCCGENQRGWKADFDFLASESGFLRVIEGKFDPTQKFHPPPNQRDFSRLVGSYD